MREIEVKLKVNNLSAVEKKLAELGCVLTEPIRQEDAIYTKEGSTEEFAASKEGHTVLRIRRLKDSAEFNLKEQRSNENDNIEYETKVSNPDAVHSILGLIGYVPAVEVKKLRRKGKLKGYEICLDTVDTLGTFVEIEKLTSDDADPEAAQEELVTVLESLGLSRTDRVFHGYDTLMYLLKKQDK